MKKSDLTALKNWLSRLNVLDAQNTDLIENAIYQCIQFHKEDITGRTALYAEQENAVQGNAERRQDGV